MRKIYFLFLIIIVSLFIIGCQDNEKESFSIHFDPNGGILSSLTLDDIDSGEVITLPVPTRDLYTFVGWSYLDDQIFVMIDGPTLKIDQDLYLTAHWEIYSYEITFYVDETLYFETSSEHGSTLTYPLPPVKEGYLFTGWYIDEHMITPHSLSSSINSSISLYAGFSELLPTLYEVEFIVDTINRILVTVEDGNKVTEIETFSQEGYHFVGWYLEAEFENLYDFDTVIDGNLALYAKYEINTYTITYHFNDESLIDVITVEHGFIIVEPLTPIRDEYKFLGWYTDVALTIPFSFLEGIDTDYTLYAKWELLIPVGSEATLMMTTTQISSLNPFDRLTTHETDMLRLVIDTLYQIDFDWNLAIDLQLASHVGDFTHTALLPYHYVPSMASSYPIDVNSDGKTWRITLKDNLTFVDETPITAEIFQYAWMQLLSPTLYYTKANYLYDDSYLPILNAESYFNQFNDELGFHVYKVSDVIYLRENAFFGDTDAGFPIYHVENKYQNLIGPDGIKAYVEFWGSNYLSYGLNGWVLETQADEYFRIGTDNLLYAPTAGWTLDGAIVPHELPIGVMYKTGGAGYAGAYPAYMDVEGNRVLTDDNGLPLGGEITYQVSPVDWSEVGFKIIGNPLTSLTFEITLSKSLSMWQVTSALSELATSVVHPIHFELGKNELGTASNYGTFFNPIIPFGPYDISEWNDSISILFTKNGFYHQADDYRITHVKYTVHENQDIAINEFKQGRLDLVSVSGINFNEFSKDPNLKFYPSSTLSRLVLNTDRLNDGDESNDHPLMRYIEFRRAIYFAMDRARYTTEVRAPGLVTLGFLGPIYYSSDANNLSYRSSIPGQELLLEYIGNTQGYDPVLAKQLFDIAYNKAVNDGYIVDGSVIKLEFVYSDAGTSFNPNLFFKNTLEFVFNQGESTPKFELVMTGLLSFSLKTAQDNGDFDITLGGWQGLNNNAPLLLGQVYNSDLDYMMEYGFDTANALVTVYLPNTRIVLETQIANFLDLDAPTETQTERYEKWVQMLVYFDGDYLLTTFHQLYVYASDELVGIESIYYLGKADDFDRITAALEGVLFDQMIAVPLFTSVQSFVHSNRLIYDQNAFHAKLGWGGIKYLSIVSN
jgi:uncharacterized repeat protein (TIGR02543 family)